MVRTLVCADMRPPPAFRLLLGALVVAPAASLTPLLPWDGPEAVVRSCKMLGRITAVQPGIRVQSPSHQKSIVERGEHLGALRAMKKFAAVYEVQSSCGQFLLNLVQWNAANAKTLGDAGAIETIVAAVRKWPYKLRTFIGGVGAFCDFVEENRVRLRKAGGLDLAFEIAQEYYGPIDQGQLMCLASTQASPHENLLKMVDLGLIKRLVKGMQDFPYAPIVRGEAIWDASTLLANNATYIAELADAGFIPELVKAMRDEPGMHAMKLSLDPLGMGGSDKGMLRMFSSAFHLLDVFAKANATYLDAILGHGGVEQVLATLQSSGDLQGTMAWGQGFSLMKSACPTLVTLTSRRGPKGERPKVWHDVRNFVLKTPSLRSLPGCGSFLPAT